MNIRWKRETFVLLAGDLAFFILALWITLFLRYRSLPDWSVFFEHLLPFSFLFLVGIVVFFISGLYDKQTNAIKIKLPTLIFNAEAVNSLLAVLFFYFMPYVAISPKANLIIYIIVSLALIVLWRLVLADIVYWGRTENVLIVGKGDEVAEITEEVNKNENYRTHLVSAGFIDDATLDKIKKADIQTIIVDTRVDLPSNVPNLVSQLTAEGIRFVDIESFYEDIFKKVPLKFVDDVWFFRNVSNDPRPVYLFIKRAMDIFLSLIIGFISLLLYPFVYLAIKLDDGGPVFIRQERIGLGNKVVNVWKIRSMTSGDRGKWQTERYNEITRVGSFLRKSRIDELPQLWSVLTGSISLIGPRPDIIGLGEQLKVEIPFYTMRNMIKPGLSGWAQISQLLPPHSVKETKERLAYDFYYLKNRSLALDLEIALKTIKTLLSCLGK
ncbi:MAG: exopolysaccharide biosynthesis polyprenyl glycosylphosphotransferase [Candidatus Paceibacterota bacterium]|jgi:exopolysaccharide biosynthesis polyprenyl glycosylphosphotransferase